MEWNKRRKGILNCPVCRQTDSNAYVVVALTSAIRRLLPFPKRIMDDIDANVLDWAIERISSTYRMIVHCACKGMTRDTPSVHWMILPLVHLPHRGIISSDWKEYAEEMATSVSLVLYWVGAILREVARSRGGVESFRINDMNICEGLCGRGDSTGKKRRHLRPKSCPKHHCWQQFARQVARLIFNLYASRIEKKFRLAHALLLKDSERCEDWAQGPYKEGLLLEILRLQSSGIYFWMEKEHINLATQEYRAYVASAHPSGGVAATEEANKEAPEEGA